MQDIIHAIRAQFWDLPEAVRKHQRRRHNRYMRDYMRTVYSKTRHRFSLTLRPDEYQQLQHAADQSGRPLAVFIRETALASLDHRTLVSKPLEHALWEAIRQFRAAGNNLNQIAHHVNTRQHALREDIQQAKAQLNAMETALNHFVLSPPPSHGDQVDDP